MSIVDVLRPYQNFLLPLFFIGFFSATFITIYLYRNKYIKQTYVAGFFIGLLVFNTVLPLGLLPYIHWHKFSEPREQEQTYYEFRVVDANGEEIPYDKTATLRVEGIRMSKLTNAMIDEYSEEKNREIMAFLLYRAEEHRDHTKQQSLIYFASFPAHGMSGEWTETQLTEYAEFVGLRLYQVDIKTSDDGTEITAHEQDRVFGYYDHGTSDLFCTYDRSESDREKPSTKVPVNTCS
ncbi:hypothetical protein [Halalkalicoccus salilacus]|uniref:hypothetical protein n=1 Tax=Halalkalicoccus sp. GCM10025704 TaxID=3252662 RepID=UPI00361118E1